MSNNFKHILNLLNSGKLNEAKSCFGEILAEQNAEYFLVKGKIEQKFQNWGSAINAFTKVLELEPTNTEAENNLKIIENILKFYNKEMFNT